MNKWTRLVSVLTAAATAVALGLSTASAGSGSTNPPSWQPPGSSTASTTGSPQLGALTLSPTVSQSIFVPVLPCRIVDTRSGGGALSSLARTFYVQGTLGFAPQGGKSGGCGIPAQASGVTADVTTTGAVARGGYLTAFPAGSDEPLSNFATYSTAGTMTVNPTFTLATATARSLSIRAHGGNVQVIIDVTGYYLPQIEGIVAPNGSLYAGTTAIVSSQRNSTGSYSITTAADVSNCAITVTIRGGAFYGNGYGSGHTITVTTWALSGTASLVPADLYYSFSVTC